MKRLLITAATAALFAFQASAIPLATYNFSNSTISPNFANFSNSAAAVPGLTVGSFTVGSGIPQASPLVVNNPPASGSGVQQMFVATSGSFLIGGPTVILGPATANSTNATDALAANDFFSFTFTPAASYDIDFTTFTFQLKYSSSNTNGGPRMYTLRSNLTGSTDLGAWTATQTLATASANLSGFSSLQNVTTPVTFQLAVYGSKNDTNNRYASLDNFNFTGTVVPEPSTVAVAFGLLAGVIGLSRRRKA